MITTHQRQGRDHEPGGDAPRIFMLHRPSLAGEAGAGRLRRCSSEGWVIVTEFDDHPDHFGMLNTMINTRSAACMRCRRARCRLPSVLRRLNPEVAVFSNMIRSLPDVRNFTDPNVVTLFFGALNREQDWAPLMPALNAVAEKAGERLRFCVVHDQGFFDALRTPHKQFTPTCDHDTYLALLGQCEISFMPLADTPFNRAKSDLKFIEAGACRVAALASHIVYADSIEDGRTGLLFRDADQLRDRLLRLVAMPNLARGLGNAARNYVASERMLAYQVSAAHRMVPLAVGAPGRTDQRVVRTPGQPAATRSHGTAAQPTEMERCRSCGRLRGGTNMTTGSRWDECGADTLS